jgi:hypothetical protein
MKIMIVAALALVLCACARHNDGMGDLWKGVKHCNEGRC